MIVRPVLIRVIGLALAALALTASISGVRVPAAAAAEIQVPTGVRSGSAFVRAADGSIGVKIPNVVLSFVKEDGSTAQQVTTNSAGMYTITLAAGKYYLLASHSGFADYNSSPGFVVVGANTTGTANVFLRKPVVTTVLIVRHGERLNDSLDSPLHADGVTRALVLRDTVFRSGVTGVYSTNFLRTRATVKPLADAFRLPITNYGSVSALATDVLAKHSGDVVLVAAHSNTVGAVLNAFGAQVPTTVIEDFDNVYVLSIAGNARHVVNLQYGAASAGTVIKNQSQAMSLLLVGSIPAGGPEPQQLHQAVGKAGVSAIFSSTAPNALVAPVAAGLGITPHTFNGSNTQGLANLLITMHSSKRVIVSGTKTELGQLISHLGGQPTPVILPTDRDNLILLTRFPGGATRVLPLRF